MEDKYKYLIGRHLSGKLSQKEETELHNWIASDPSHEILYKEAESVWKLSEDKYKIYTPDTKNEWFELKEKIDAEDESPKLISITSYRKWYSIAAAILIVIGLGYLLKATLISGDITKLTAGTIDVFYLSDSSIVYLNKNSKLTYPESFDGNERKVSLEGEAFFKIRKDSLHPFIIEAAGTRTQVLGTSFNLKAYKEDTNLELVVATGKVSFSNEEANITLEKDQKGAFNKEDKKLSSGKNDNPNFLAWKNDPEALKNTELYKQEHANSLVYLSNESSWKRNKINQTIIEGYIHNTAIFTEFKNVKMKVTYSHAGGSKLGESHFTIHKTIPPGSSVKYKHALHDWFDSTHEVRIEIDTVENINENF